ncbi:hypothetical protein V9T40_010712 [Parthenolecanium corni]|uniref:Dethiobiotin synthase n=1 Tax=Parthenolecanium corni TaxID=536013 RepID=A0AAN9XXF9_9HEMI
MRIFVTGTDTDVGKTTICSWLCLHTNYAYLKPIQTGGPLYSDTQKVRELSEVITYEETYTFAEPVSPHLAAKLEHSYIDVDKIKLPADTNNLIVEGAGGLYVPLNDDLMMIDLIQKLNIPVILVARTSLGTINHTLLSLNALRQREIPILGIILNGPNNEPNRRAIEFYGKQKVLATFPEIPELSKRKLLDVELSEKLKELFDIPYHGG